MRKRYPFDYAVVRVVPRVDRGEFLNAGVIVFSSTAAFLGARIELDRERLNALAPGIDLALVEGHLDVIPKVCAGGERIGDPVANHSHAVTVRQLLRFYWLLSRGELVSPAASQKMREIFLSPDIPHDDHKFVKGLSGRGLTILRKSGTWEDWLHDSAIVEGPGRRYILVGLTHHPKGDAYLEELAREVDDLMVK